MKESNIQTLREYLNKCDFYNSILEIQNLEKNAKTKEEENEVLFLYYFYYVLLDILEKNDKKDEYFQKLCKIYKKAEIYFKFFEFLDSNYWNFQEFLWFDKENLSEKFLNLAFQNDMNSKEINFYNLYIKKKFYECFEYLLNYELDLDLVYLFLNRISFTKKFEKQIFAVLEKYKAKLKVEYYFRIRFKDYKWLYEYFLKYPAEKNEEYIYIKSCFNLKKYDEIINFYENNKVEDIYRLIYIAKSYKILANKEKAIEIFIKLLKEDNFLNEKAIKNLFELKAYKEIKEILESKDLVFSSEKCVASFYLGKILYLEKKYNESIKKLDFIKIEDLKNTFIIKKDLYMLYIKNFYQLILKELNISFKNILRSKNFNLESQTFHYSFALDYTYYAYFHKLKDYIYKVNIEFNYKFKEDLGKYIKKLQNERKKLLQTLYLEAKRNNIELNQDIETFYLSFFDDLKSRNKMLNFLLLKLNSEPEKPYFNLSVANIYFNLKDYEQAKKYYVKSLEYAKKYLIDLEEMPYLQMIKMENSNEEKRNIFDNYIKNFSFFSSFPQGITKIFMKQTLYKYQSFSVNTLSSLSNSYFYFPNPKQLNDPFEVPIGILEKNIDISGLDKNRFKLFSLSQLQDNKLMWSHYAQSHEGICVGYKFFYFPKNIGKIAVQYKNTNLSEKDLFSYIIDYWRVKSEDWAYEKEVRLLHYGENSKISYTFDKNEALEKNMLGLKIESIAFGLNFKETKIMKQIIQDIEKRQKSKVKVLQAEIIGQNLNFKKIALKTL